MSLKDLFFLLVIICFAFFTRIFNLAYPASMYFDELYHVPTAMMMADGDFIRPFEYWHQSYDGINSFDWLHPPLAKYFQAFSMTILGKNAFAWRLPSLLFSLVTLILFYFFLKFLGENFLFKKKKKKIKTEFSSKFSLIGTFFFSLEGLFLVQSRIAMNDVFLLFFLLMAVFLYFYYLSKKENDKKKDLILFLMSFSWGLALASKWSAIFSLSIIFIFHLFKLFLARKSLKTYLQKLPFLLFIFLLMPAFVYFLTYVPMFLAGKNLSYFFLLQRNILLSQLNNPTLHLYASKPISWIFNLSSIHYFKGSSNANIYAVGNPLLFVYFILSFLYFLIFFFRKIISQSYGQLKKEKSFQALLIIFLLYLSNFIFWIFVRRISFFYHYLPAIPFIIILSSYFLLFLVEKVKDQSKKRALLFNLIFWPFLSFLIFYPHWIALIIPEDFLFLRNSLYFLLESWR